MRRSLLALSVAIAACTPSAPPAPSKTAVQPPATPSRSLTEAEVRGTIEQILEQPLGSQAKAWRAVLADRRADPRLLREAVLQLGRISGPASTPVLIELLGRTQDHATIAAIARALLETPAGGPATALRPKLESASDEDRGPLAVALVQASDTESWPALLELLKKGALDGVRRLDGEPAFEPKSLCRLQDKARFRVLAEDPLARVRAVAATCVSQNVDTTDVGVLARLVTDVDAAVVRAAAGGLAQLAADPTARAALRKGVTLAEKSDDEARRTAVVAGLRDTLGGKGLILALDSIVPEGQFPEESRARHLLEELVSFADPTAESTYVAYVGDAKQPPHFRARVAITLGEIGSRAAFPFLAARMDAEGIGFQCGKDKSAKCRSANLGWIQQPPAGADPITFREQTSAARLLGDLAILAPQPGQLAIAAPHLERFASWFPAPWLVVARAQSLLGDPKTLASAKTTVTTWKLPPESLVELYDDPSCKGPPGCRIFRMNAFAAATRSVALAHDATVLDTLIGHLARPSGKSGPVRLSPADMELATNPGYREVALNTAQAAADGLAEWGPGAAAAASRLAETIRDKDHGTFVRVMAARALGRVASEKDLVALLRSAKAEKDAYTRAALAMASVHRATPELVDAALDLLVPTDDPAMLRSLAWAARVVGYGGTSGHESRLLTMLEHKSTRVYAALAIALGGDLDLLARGMVSFAARAHADGSWEQEIAGLRALYLDTFDGREVTLGDVESGRLFRFVGNADWLRRVGVAGDSPFAWAWGTLRTGFARLDLEVTVPGGLDRTLLRHAVRTRAEKAESPMAGKLAVLTLRQLGERGSLFALREAPLGVGEAARRALVALEHDELEKGEYAKPDGYFSRPKF